MQDSWLIHMGRSTTVTQAVQGHDLSGKVAVVTGGNSGLGVQTVGALASAGARVIMTSRNIGAGQDAAAHLQHTMPGMKGSIEVRQLDLADLLSVQQLAAGLAKVPRIDLLVLNAGIMMCPRQFSRDGFELQWATNHLGHAALTSALLPKLQSQAMSSRIVVLSSSAHKFQKQPIPWDISTSATANTHRGVLMGNLRYQHHGFPQANHLANILYVKALAERLKGTSVSVFAVHPGVVATELWRHTWSLTGWFNSCFNFAAHSSFFGVKTPEQGAATTVYAAVEPGLEANSGAYLADCRVDKPAKLAQDPKQAAALWDVTEAQLAKARTTRASLNKAMAEKDTAGGGASKGS